MKELSKSIGRRLTDSNFIRRYFVGNGVDIGGKPDPLTLYGEFFPRMTSVKIWDWEDGDAQFMTGVADDEYDFVHSSHCLEHLQNPAEGLNNWFRILKPGGYMVLMVPDEDLYEQNNFPSTYNRDHKWTFTVHKDRSWSDRSINVLQLVSQLGPQARVEKVQLLDATYRFDLPRYDQTQTPVAECAIEVIIRKTDEADANTGQRARAQIQPTPFLRRYFNQYRIDVETLKRANPDNPPFQNESEI